MTKPVVCLAVIFPAYTVATAESEQTNIVLLMVDDICRETIGVHGGES